MDDEEAKHEIIIIRRRGSSDMDAVKGGAWKIAFADFMTAMMAFFLVLWILSATKKETQKVIAHYFNPFQLSEAKLNKKGVENQNTKDSTQEENKTDIGSDANKIQRDNKDETNQKTIANENSSKQNSDGESKQTILQNNTLPVTAAENPFLDSFFLPNKTTPYQTGDTKIQNNTDQNKDVIVQHDEKKPSSLNTTHIEKNIFEEKTIADSDDPELLDIKKQLSIALDPNSGDTKVALKKIKEGYLISLTDQINFEMFDNGDIAPSSKIYDLLKTIAQVLSKHNEKIVIRGHTDSRQFKNKLKDNWQLSASRALSVMYILINSGLPEKSIARIEAYSDHLPKPNSAQAPSEDRRIDILLLKESK